MGRDVRWFWVWSMVLTFHLMPLWIAGFNSCCRAIQQCPLDPLLAWAHWCCSPPGQRGYLWHMQEVPWHRKANLHQLEQVDLTDHIITYHLPEVWWCYQRGCYWVPDQPCAVPTYPFHAFLICPCNLCWEGLPWAALCAWNHQCCFWALKHDGQVWPKAREVHGLLLDVPWWCCSQGCQRCCCNHQDQENCPVCGLVSCLCHNLSCTYF